MAFVAPLIGAPCRLQEALYFFAPDLGRRKAAHTRSFGDTVHASVKSKPRLGRVDNRSGVPCSVLGKEEAGRADTQLAEQARNRDQHSSDPCSQAKKQKKTTLCSVTLPFQEIACVWPPTHGALKLAQKLGCPRDVPLIEQG